MSGVTLSLRTQATGGAADVPGGELENLRRGRSPEGAAR